MRLLLVLAALAAGCQPPMLAARGSFIASAGPAGPARVAVAPAPGLVIGLVGAASAVGLASAAGTAGAGAVRADVSVHISFFGIPLAGSQDVVFVLDRSGSMDGVSAGFAGQDVGMSKTGAALAGIGASIVNAKTKSLPSKMQAAKDELVHTLSVLPDGTRFTIIFFDSAISAFAPRLIVLDPGTRAAAIGFVRGIHTGGSTAAVPALHLAYQAGAARVVLLSDGLANTGGGADTLLAEARDAMRAGVRFDTVGLGIDQDAALLTTLAAESGGMAIKR
jgi:hypothetical protein